MKTRKTHVWMAAATMAVTCWIGVGTSAAAVPVRAPISPVTINVTGIGGTAASAEAVNDEGLVVGSVTIPPTTQESHLFAKTKAGPVEDLGIAPWGTTHAAAVNNHNVIAGTSGGFHHSARHAFRWTRSGGFEDLTPLIPGGPNAEATAINDRGEIAITTYRPGLPPAAYVFEPATNTVVALGDLGHGATAAGINDEGTIAGSAFSPADGGVAHAAVWDGPHHQLHDLGGGTIDSAAAAINDHGTVAGHAGDHAWVWTDHGRRHQDLGPGTAVAVNNRGLVLTEGPADPTTGAQALSVSDLPRQSHVTLDTHSFGQGYAINNHGLAVGWVSDVTTESAATWTYQP